MKLEVGKTYVDFYDNKVTIVDHDPEHLLPFVGDDGCGYQVTGKFGLKDSSENSFDLIAEHKEPEDD